MIRKVLVFGLVLAASAVSNVALALEGMGTVEEIRICANSHATSHKTFMFYRLSDGNWFGIYANTLNNSIAYGGDTSMAATQARNQLLCWPMRILTI